MKEQFYEYIDPTTDEIREVWKNGIISVDANILLNLYRYTKETREDFFSILEKCQSQLWLTHQAGEEFFKNRRNLFKALKGAYQKRYEEIESEIKKIKSQAGKQIHPTIEASKISEYLDNAVVMIKDYLDKAEKEHPNYTDNDPILTRVVNLFNGRIGEAYSKERIVEIHKIGQTRFKEEIPPGYCDGKNKKEEGSTNRFGDLVLWMQLVDKSKAESKPLIFVTDDNKSDWWLKENNISVGPRRELVREFHDDTKQRILIYNSSDFLKLTKEHYANEINEATLNEVKRVDKSIDATPCDSSFLKDILVKGEDGDIFMIHQPNFYKLETTEGIGIFNDDIGSSIFVKGFDPNEIKSFDPNELFRKDLKFDNTSINILELKK